MLVNNIIYVYLFIYLKRVNKPLLYNYNEFEIIKKEKKERKYDIRRNN